MGTSLLCRLGYHKFSPWEEKTLDRPVSQRSPRRESRRIRRCGRCGLEHTDYSPQEGMLMSPPGSSN
jgi:hypothetical protein